MQGFPDEMFDRAEMINSVIQLYKQAGNFVTVTVVSAIDMRILEAQNRIEGE